MLRVLRAFPRLAGKKESLLGLLLTSRAGGDRSGSPVTEVGVDTPPPPPPASKQGGGVDGSGSAKESAPSTMISSTGTISGKNTSSGSDPDSGPGSSPSSSPGPCVSPYLIDLILRLVRICSVSSQRTKIYLQTVQLLPSAASPNLPASLGSVLSTGGAPLLEDLRPALTEMLATARGLGSGPGLGLGLEVGSGVGPEIASQPTSTSPSPWSQLVQCLLDHIQLDCTNMARRDLAAEWRLEGGFAPTIFKDRALLDKASLTLPSPALAVWFTTVLLGSHPINSPGVGVGANNNPGELSTSTTTTATTTVTTRKTAFDPTPTISAPSPSPVIETVVAEGLGASWCLALRSPSMAVKTCAMRVLSGILQATPHLSQLPSPLQPLSMSQSQLAPFAHRLQVITLLQAIRQYM